MIEICCEHSVQCYAYFDWVFGGKPEYKSCTRANPAFRLGWPHGLWHKGGFILYLVCLNLPC